MPHALEPLADLLVTIADPLIVGPVTGGVRAVVPITGGGITGRGLSGQVLPGGADWATLQEDGSAEVDARYLIRLDDGTLLTVHNRGRCTPVLGADQVYSGWSAPQLECAAPALAWLAQSTLVASFRSDLATRQVQLTVLRVVPGTD